MDAQDATPAGFDDPVPSTFCAVCNRLLNPGSAFCGGCGNRLHAIGSATVAKHGDAIKVLLGLYGLCLLTCLAGTVYVRASDDRFGADLMITLTISVLVLIYALFNHGLVDAPLRKAGFSLRSYCLIAMASIPILAVVGGYALGLSSLFGIHLESELSAYAGRSLIWPLLLMVVLPPLSEELAFRGLVYAGLRRTLSVPETFIISSFAFAMLHLSVPMLATHLPLGLYFCWLRHRSGSLWPSTFAHACHNLGVLLAALYWPS